MPLVAPQEEKGPFLKRSFMNWMVTHPKTVSNHAYAAHVFYTRLQKDDLIPKNPSVIEYFGGAGVHAVIAESILHPRKHVVIERHPKAVEQLRAVACEYPNIQIVSQSFEQYCLQNRDDIFDIHDLDNPAFTAAKFFHYQRELGQIFGTQPAVVKMADVASRKMCFNKKHFVRYLESNFDSYAGYIRLLSKKFYELFDYSIMFAYTYSGVGLLCLTHGCKEPDITALEDEPLGFVIK